MYASLLISLLAAFIAMLGKQWLNRYLRNSGRSMIERCGDRQRKCDGLEKWPLHFFIESLPVMLQVALFLLACGLCRYMWSVNAAVTYTLIGLTGLGATFYTLIVVAGMSSYSCPFQTPASAAFRCTWKRVRPEVVSSYNRFKQALSRAIRTLERSVWPLLHCQLLPIAIPLRNAWVRGPEPWLKPKDLAIIRTENDSDVRCVSWILRNITDPEALDAAVRLAGTIRWFDDGINADLPYGSIVSTFEACFDPAGKLYSGSRDRAYYSGRAMVWIHTLARCKSEAFALGFPLSHIQHEREDLDPDLRHLLRVNEEGRSDRRHVSRLLATHPEYTPSHAQWISDVLLRLSWATRSELAYEAILDWKYNPDETKITIPLNATLNRLLVWCIFLGSPVTEDALKVEKKSCDTSYFAFQTAHRTLR